MHDPTLVRRIERIDNLPRERQRLTNPQSLPRISFELLRKRLALDQLHHDGLNAVALLESVDRRDVGVAQRRQHARLALEPRQPIGIARERRGQDLDRHVAPQLRVPRAIDLAHPAGAKRRHDLVRAEAAAD